MPAKKKRVATDDDNSGADHDEEMEEEEEEVTTGTAPVVDTPAVPASDVKSDAGSTDPESFDEESAKDLANSMQVEVTG